MNSKLISNESMVFILFDLFQAKLEGLKGRFKQQAKMYYNGAIKVNSKLIKEYNKTLKKDTEVGLELSAYLLLLINNYIDKLQNISIDELNNLIKEINEEQK
jgi:hypothetical protein